MRVVLTVLVGLVGALSAHAPPAGAAAWWMPEPGMSWQVQFTGAINRSVAADVFDLDGFDTKRSLVRALHAQGDHAVCYVNAGAWEDWRPDAGRFPASVKGKPLDGWPGERLLDVRRLDVLEPILRDRIAMCGAKGFDAIEFDNIDGYSNDTGFDLDAGDQLRFDRWLARTAHDAGLGVGLKNTLGLAEQLAPAFDFALLEQCFQYRECELARPFSGAGKQVVDIEYSLPRSSFCAKAMTLGIDAMKKRLALDAWRRPCA